VNDIHTRKGYSLIELIAVLAIVSVLFSFATTTWQQALMTTRRSDATTGLQQIAGKQEMFRLQHQRYADSSELAPPPPSGLGVNIDTSAHYLFTTKPSTTGFTAAASAHSASPQKNDTLCQLFMIDESGRQIAQTGTGEDSTQRCWKS
jgi:type IV pilus assembly protein PilE